MAVQFWQVLVVVNKHAKTDRFETTGPNVAMK